MTLKRGNLYQIGKFRLDTVSKRLLCDGQIVALTPKVIDLLAALVEGRDRTMSKEELLTAVWPNTFVEEGNLTQSISVLRKALADGAPGRDYILTVPREGYRFVGPVRELGAESTLPIVPATSRRRWIWTLASGFVIVGLIGGLAPRLIRKSSPAHALQLSINPPVGGDFRSQSGSAISPDGRLVAFVAHRSNAPDRLWVRSLDSPVPRELAGTEDATFPFWKPDSREVGFFASGKLKRIGADGGNPVIICDAPANRGATWNREGVIVFPAGNDTPLQRVSAFGGVPERLTTLDVGENSHRWPQFLPDGRHLLFFVRVGYSAENRQKMGIYLTSLDRPSEKTLIVSNVTSGAYVPETDERDGDLLWVHDGKLMAQAFDFNRGRLVGDASVVTEPVYTFQSASFLTAAENGSLLCERAPNFKSSLTWYSREGRRLGTLGSPDYYLGVRISPDGRRIALERLDPAGPPANTWVMDINRGIAARLTFSYGLAPVWSPDGKTVIYAGPGPAGNPPNLFSRGVDGRGVEERLTESHNTQTPDDWSPDGRYVVYNDFPNDLTPHPPPSLWLLSMKKGAKPTRLLGSAFRERHARFSPDGEWIAYTSNESGRNEIYVQRFPPDGTALLVSKAGGDFARWRRDGKELFYLSPARAVMSASAKVVGTWLEFRAPVELFHLPDSHVSTENQIYDVAPDGRFLALTPAEEMEASRLFVLVGWQSALSKRN